MDQDSQINKEKECLEEQKEEIHSNLLYDNEQNRQSSFYPENLQGNS